MSGTANQNGAAPGFAPEPTSLQKLSARIPIINRLNRNAVWIVAVGSVVMLLFILASTISPARPHYLVAVMNFTVSGESAHFGNNLADHVAAEINARQLPVISRDISSRGDLHGAHYVVSGDIRRGGDLVRIDVRLDDARSGLSLWTDTIARSAAEADILQDEVADKVADQLDLVRRWLGPHDEGASPEAVAALFKATDVLRGGNATLDGDSRGLPTFSRPGTKFVNSAFKLCDGYRRCSCQRTGGHCGRVAFGGATGGRTSSCARFEEQRSL